MMHKQKMKVLQWLTIMTAMIYYGCDKNSSQHDSYSIIDSTVTPMVETTPVPSRAGEDAADDPAIWIHPEDIMKSKIIGTDKTGGLAVYNLQGEEVYYYPVGRANNVDLSYNFQMGDHKVDVVAATNRSDNTLTLMRVEQSTGELFDIAARKMESGLAEVYGITTYVSPQTNHHYVFVNGKEGMVEQWKLFATDQNKIDAEVVRTFQLESQPEGMVADNEKAYLYVGEENRCIWKYGAEPDDGNSRQKVYYSDTSNPQIDYDIEGLALYYASGGKGYLIASSQGNNSFAIFERWGDNKYVTSFRVKEGRGIDGLEETDGIDVINRSFSATFPGGFFVAQDGLNYEGDSLKNQNFKLIDWRDISRLVEPALMVDTAYQP